MAKDGKWVSGEFLPDDSSSDVAASVPIDIAAVRHDDALIEAIANDREFECADADERHIAALFEGWRSEIVDRPLPQSPDLDLVVAEVNHAINARRYRNASMQGLRLLRPVMSAAAVLAIVVGGLSVFSYNAAPGDALWGVKEVVFKEQAESTVAQIDTNEQLQQVYQAIQSDDPVQAVEHLSEAAEIAKEVKNEELYESLMTRVTEYMSMVQSTFPNSPIADALSTIITPTPPTSVTQPPVDNTTTNNPPATTDDPTVDSGPGTTDPVTVDPTTTNSPETTTTTQGTTQPDTGSSPVGQSEPGSVPVSESESE